MEYLHRILIGFTGGLGRSTTTFQQDNTNKIAFYVGKQLGEEMVARGIISDKMSTEDILKACNGEFKLVENCTIRDGGSIKLSVSGCNVCPKKVGKYTIKETACPLPGIMRGVLATVHKDATGVFPKLNPGEICHIEFGPVR